MAGVGQKFQKYIQHYQQGLKTVLMFYHHKTLK